MKRIQSAFVTLGLPLRVIEDDDVLRHIRDRTRRLLAAGPTAAAPPPRPAVRDPIAELRAEIFHPYVFCTAGEVSAEVKAEVADGVWRACNKIAGFPAASNVTPPMSRPQVRYFRAARAGEKADFEWPGPLNGLHTYGSDFIAIRVGPDRTPAQARRTGAHEVWHWSKKREARDEVSAANFAAQFVA